MAMQNVIVKRVVLHEFVVAVKTKLYVAVIVNVWKINVKIEIKKM